MMSQTGIIYDERMCLHQKEGHPEQPERIRAIYNEIKENHLLELCQMIEIREATEEEISLVHSIRHLNNMQNIPEMDPKELYFFQFKYGSIYFNKHSYQSALLSAGGTIELCDQIMQGNILNGIAIVRPPGHHAECDRAMGFCLFNNVGIAAKAIINKYNLNRVAIIDWDVHHGNGIQNMFEDDPSVLYISIHRYDHATFYPGSKNAAPEKIGKEKGTGFNVNIAWNLIQGARSVGDTEYLYAFETLIKPMLREYDPELIIVSAGFDAAINDPLGGLKVTPTGYYLMTKELMSFANGKIALMLEGGYNLGSISKSMTACLKALLKIELTEEIKIRDEISCVATDAVYHTMKAHKNHWKFLNDNN